MLGDLIGEFKGKVSGYRVLGILPTGPKMEISHRQSGKLLGVEAMDIATYWSIMAGPDALYGEGSGALQSKSGEMAMYRASGATKMMKGVMPRWRGTIYLQSPTPKWASLNGAAVVYEYEVDENDNTHVKLWEWK